MQKGAEKSKVMMISRHSLIIFCISDEGKRAFKDSS
jgi:hypothetical protein